MRRHSITESEIEQVSLDILTSLNPEGIFVNAEQVLGGTPELEAYYKKEWEDAIRRGGVSEEEISAWKERLKLDRESTVERQVLWLKEAGFDQAGCAFKYFKFAVIFGVKGKI